MAAALAIAPLAGTIAVKTTSAPAVSSAGDGFGQVMQSVWGIAARGAAARDAAARNVAARDAASGPVAVPADDVSGPPGAADADPETPDLKTPDPKAGAPGEAAVGTDRAAEAAMAIPTGKLAHRGKDDSGAAARRTMELRDADPAAAMPSPAMPSPAMLPATGGVAEPAPTAVAVDGLDTGGMTATAVVPFRTAVGGRGMDIGGRPPQVASTAGQALRAAPDRSTGPSTGPDPSTGRDFSTVLAPNGLAGRDGVSSDWNAPLPRPHETSGSGGQSAVPAPAPLLPTAAAGVASPPAPLPADMPVGTDHKITLRQAGAGAGADAGAAADAGADPAPPAAASGAMAEQVVPTATPAAVATPSAVTAASRPRPASPAEQLAPALLTLAKTAGGGQQMTVRLQPADLGMVQVRIAQAASGATRIDITAENPATLLALQRDQPQLHRSLDEAGIAAAGRTITFHVAQAAAGGGANAGHTGSQPGAGGRNSPGSAGGDGATGRDGSAGGGADGSAVGGRGSSGARERTAYPTGRRPGEPVTAADPRGTTSTQLYHIGLDITA